LWVTRKRATGTGGASSSGEEGAFISFFNGSAPGTSNFGSLLIA
jgi:hypothetical protein